VSTSVGSPASPAASGSVQVRLDALQAERDATWTPAQLEKHAAVRRSLEVEARRRRMVRPGDVVAPFTLQEVDGGQVTLTDLLATGPVVLIFFRYEGCPACNAAWRGYRISLAPALRQLGAHLVAISTQRSDKLVAIKRRLGFDFPVVSDPNATVTKRLGIAFAPSEAERDQMRLDGQDLGAMLGTESWHLAYPTAVVVGQDGVVRFADIHPDWMVRTESATIVDAVAALTCTDSHH
jgi:peroxiredoxin